MANPLTLLLPIRADADAASLAAAIRDKQPRLRQALAAIGTVHYARLMLLDRAAPNLQPGPEPSDRQVLAVIGEYDGPLERCALDLAREAGAVFDPLLRFVDGADALLPVAKHPQDFAAFVRANDATPRDAGQYQAYVATAREIMAALP
ncbi:hypothetical protein [Chromobacterium sp. CV08]|uniref:hypothetical protein n=1 Tax=Chromobacterium sp. CV08 TaxID=3133274 RepID=UPI003DA7AC52